MPEIILEVKNLKKNYELRTGVFRKLQGIVHAVDDVSFDIQKGETLALVGESGCGKTTTALTILRLIEPTAGDVYFEGRNVFKLKGGEIRQLRRKIQMIFQDPFASLNPRMTVYNLVSEALDIHHVKTNKREETMKLIEKVGLSSDDIYRYPHEFSGGQRQRIGIARALAIKPKFLVADEPVSSLDVSVRAQILNLLKDLRDEFELTVMLVSHDLSVVKYMCDRVAVMYVGKLIELAETRELFCNPQHPYTRAILSAVPVPNPLSRTRKMQRTVLKGEVPTAINPPPGCRFYPRCDCKKPICKEVEPKLVKVSESHEHLVACHSSYS